MAEEKSYRDTTLVKILVRLAKQIDMNDAHLEEIEKTQRALAATVEDMNFHQGLWQDETGIVLEKQNQNLARYRTDMYNIVSEQDRIDKNMKDMAVKQEAVFAAQEVITKALMDLDARFAIQEKSIREHIANFILQKDALSKELSAVSTHITNLHMDMEKQLIEDYKKTQRKFEELRLETMRRMLAFDGIEEMLHILLSRTEPPPPKELPKIIKLLGKGVAFVRRKIYWLFFKVSGFLRKKFWKINK